VSQALTTFGDRRRSCLRFPQKCIYLPLDAPKTRRNKKSTPGRTRTCNQRIRNQLDTPKNPEKYDTFQQSAAQGAALSANISSADLQLVSVIDAWPNLAQAIRDSIVAIILAMGGRHE